MLTKEQMKKVVGGVLQSTCTYLNDCNHTRGSYTCTGSADDCQSAADLLCNGNQCCGTVDCLAA